MAFENLFLTTRRSILAQNSLDELDGINKYSDEGAIMTMDGTIRETTVHTATPTQNPVESGVTIADHIIRQPKRFTLVAVLTDTPITLAGAVQAITESVGSVADATGLFGDSNSDESTRALSLYTDLVNILQTGTLVTVQTGLGEYEDLALTSISVPQDKDTSNSIHFTAEFMEMLIVESTTTALPISDMGADKPDGEQFGV